MTRRSWLVFGVVLALLVGGLWIVGASRNSSSANAGALATPTSSTGIESIVTAKGVIVPTRYARLAFSTGGVIAQVMVKVGDKVKAGDVLAQLDARDLQLQVQSAQDALDVATAALLKLKAGGTAEEIAVAEANVRSAQAEYDRIKNGPDASDLAIAQANLAKAEAARQAAQAAFDKVGGNANPNIGMLPESVALQKATEDYNIAKANFDMANRVDEAALASAQAALYKAQMALDALKNGPSAADLAVSQARVRQAQTAIEQAQAALTKATLVAPFDGTITSLVLHGGEMATAGGPAITLADLSRLNVETTDLDEWGAARVKLGQAAKVTVSAFASKILTGKVTNIASQSTTLPTGGISYVVTIALDQQDLDVRWGMTVKVEFQRQAPVARGQ